MTNLPQLTCAELEQLARNAPSADGACVCSATSLSGWQSLPLSLPATGLRDIATLVQGDPHDASYAEFHPSGTRYSSDSAPIAPRHYPYNRCTVCECRSCGRLFLHYTETGGYFVDPRIRALDPDLIVDAPLE